MIKGYTSLWQLACWLSGLLETFRLTAIFGYYRTSTLSCFLFSRGKSRRSQNILPPIKAVNNSVTRGSKLVALGGKEETICKKGEERKIRSEVSRGIWECYKA